MRCFPRFTLDAETVMARLEDEKTSPEESHEKQVGYDKVSESYNVTMIWFKTGPSSCFKML